MICLPSRTRLCLPLRSLTARSESIRPKAKTQTTNALSVLPRRALLLGPVISSVFPALAFDVPEAQVRPELAPDASKYDPTDERLRQAALRIQDALNAEEVTQEEQIWTEIIKTYSKVDAPWVPDVVGRAWGNRGNARSRQGRMDEAIGDLNKAMELCPWSVDPILNRGVVLESLGRFDEAIRDYRILIAAAPYDPAGNAYAGKGDWGKAAEYYGRASLLAPEFLFARANKAVALYQIGQDAEALSLVRTLLRRNPEFVDMRAALVAIQWNSGEEGEAETEWSRVQDPRYADKSWLQESRRWPPRLVQGMTAFLDLRSL